MKNNYLFILLFALLTGTVSCQERPKKQTEQAMNSIPKEERFSWQIQASAPMGYPVEVVKGGIYSKDGSWSPLTIGIITGADNWGVQADGMTTSDIMPVRLDFIWMSYVEKCFYAIDTLIDYDKSLEVFKERYDLKLLNGSGNTENVRHTGVCVGMAPGGVVVVWATGFGRQTEIGRYQAHRYEFSGEELSRLDSYEDRFFRPEYLAHMDTSTAIIPAAVRKENAGKPIPYGLWDKYRKRYSWKPSIQLPEGETLNTKSSFTLGFFNGEFIKILFETFPLQDNLMRALPRSMSFSWRAKEGKYYSAYAKINYNSAAKAFSKVFADVNDDSITAELQLRVGLGGDQFSMQLIGSNGKSAYIQADDTKVFHATKYKD